MSSYTSTSSYVASIKNTANIARIIIFIDYFSPLAKLIRAYQCPRQLC